VVNDDLLRAELARIGSRLPDGPDRSAAALGAGRRLAWQRRSRVRAAGTVLAVTAAFAAYGVAGPRPTPASASVSCYADRVVVTHRRVAVGRAGVRLDVTNATPGVVQLVVGDEATILPPGRTSVEVALRPGEVALRCDSGGSAVPVASLQVTDRHHFFVDDSLDCARPRVRTYRGAGDVVAGDPVALTAARVAGAVPRGAVVEPAGYPAAPARRLVRVRADTHIVGLAVWHAMPAAGTWTLDELRVCDGSVVGAS
jgi:hypothetical protein